MGLTTAETKKSVAAFLNSLTDENQRKESKALVSMISKITGKKPKIWGENNIIGFGKYRYKRKGGKQEFQWFNVGFAPRKDKLSIYLTCYLDKESLVKKLGKCMHGKGCLYIKTLSDVNISVLKKLISKYKDGAWYA